MEQTAAPTSLSPPYASCLTAIRLSQAPDEEAARDDELVRQACAAGGEAALEELSRRYRRRIYTFVLTLLRRPDDAEDVTQDIFVRAFRGLSGYRAQGQFRSWLFTIAANVCRDFCRRAGSRAQPAVDAPLEQLCGDAGDLDSRIVLRTTVQEAIGRLPAAYRAPVVLHYLEQLSTAEVAAVLRRSRPLVKIQLWRARALLASDLSDLIER